MYAVRIIVWLISAVLVTSIATSGIWLVTNGSEWSAVAAVPIGVIVGLLAMRFRPPRRHG